MTIVVVAPYSHGCLLELQAKSFSLYMNTPEVEEILIIQNFRENDPATWQGALLRAYGNLADRVRFLAADDISAFSPSSSGWWTQQVLKIQVAEHVITPEYAIFDTKNHLCGPLRLEHLKAADGRFWTSLEHFQRHPLAPNYYAALNYFGVSPDLFLEGYPSTATPYVLSQAKAVGLLRTVESREQESFARAFLRLGVTDFIFYVAYIAANEHDFSNSYAVRSTGPTIIWPRQHDGDKMRTYISKAKCSLCPVFGVHMDAYRLLTLDAQLFLAHFWAELDLFPSVESGMNFIALRSNVSTC